MTHYLLPDASPRRLVFYLAMEEYVADTFGEGFFSWRVSPTVIFGRNQDIEAEVNLQYCREAGVQCYRRKSGGGCVYSDMGNIMLSCIVPGTDVKAIFGRYLDTLAGALRDLGFDASRTEHNDVLVGDRKVSGNAYFARGGTGIVHGTLLYDTDFGEMQKCITPSREKLESHGVKSVRQRVENLRGLGLKMSCEELQSYLIGRFTDSARILTADDLRAIEEIEREYLDPSFILGRRQL